MPPLQELQPQPLAGHFWTLAGYLGNRLRAPAPPASRPFSEPLHDPVTGAIRVTGRLSEVDDSRLLIVLHGIAGNCDSGYALRAAAAARGAGMSCLRLNLRGADRSGQDLFHAGLTDDLHAVLASPTLARYRSIHLLGYSLGGHVALRTATESSAPRLASVAAICSPLDLAACAAAFDRPPSWIYRWRILGELTRSYGRVVGSRSADEARRIGLTPIERVARASYLREFDQLTVVPRFGFRDVEEYYRSMSVGPTLDRLRVPALLVAGLSDPLVPLATLEPFLRTAPPALSVTVVDRGGHVGFPARASLGRDAPPGIESQVLAWLADPSTPAAG